MCVTIECPRESSWVILQELWATAPGSQKATASHIWIGERRYYEGINPLLIPGKTFISIWINNGC